MLTVDFFLTPVSHFVDAKREIVVLTVEQEYHAVVLVEVVLTEAQLFRCGVVLAELQHIVGEFVAESEM